MKIKKIITSLALFLVLISFAHGVRYLFTQTVNAEFDSFLPQIEETTELPTFDTGQHGESIQKPGISNITSAIFYVLDFFKFLIGSIAVIMIIMTGIKLVFVPRKVDEVWPKQKEHLIMIVIGFVVIMLADVLVKRVFFGVEGEIYNSESSVQQAALIGTDQIKGIYNAIMLFAGALAIIMVVMAGLKLITRGSNEEVQTKVKKQLMWLIIGLFLIGVAEFVVQDIIFPEKGESIPSAQKAIDFIVGITNFASAFISIAAFISCMYAGFLYVTASGNEEKTGKAKKILLGAVIALVLALGAFALVNTVIRFEPGI